MKTLFILVSSVKLLHLGPAAIFCYPINWLRRSYRQSSRWQEVTCYSWGCSACRTFPRTALWRFLNLLSVILVSTRDHGWQDARRQDCSRRCYCPPLGHHFRFGSRLPVLSWSPFPFLSRGLNEKLTSTKRCCTTTSYSMVDNMSKLVDSPSLSNPHFPTFSLVFSRSRPLLVTLKLVAEPLPPSVKSVRSLKEMEPIFLLSRVLITVSSQPPSLPHARKLVCVSYLST